jgi:hypothetical protein
MKGAFAPFFIPLSKNTPPLTPPLEGEGKGEGSIKQIKK